MGKPWYYGQGDQELDREDQGLDRKDQGLDREDQRLDRGNQGTIDRGTKN